MFFSALVFLLSVFLSDPLRFTLSPIAGVFSVLVALSTSPAAPLQPASPPLSLRCRIMGRKNGGLFINPKRFGSLQKPCMKEMVMFLNCMITSHNDTDACARQKELLNACMDSQSKKNRKSWGSINYQLQRLSRGRK